MSEPLTGRVWLYHSEGAKVELPVVADNPQIAYEHISAYLAAGWLVNAPDNAGLDRLDVSHVVRGVVTNENRTTPRIYMYSAWGKQDMGSQLTVYLNTPDDIAAFESASGIRIDSLPIVKGKAAPTKESGDFERNARSCQFTVFRRKEDDERSPVKYRWVLDKYANGATPTRAQGAQSNAHDSGEAKNGKSQEGGKTGQKQASDNSWENTSWNRGLITELCEQFEGVYTPAQIAGILGVERFSDWTQGAQAAFKTVQQHKQGQA